MKILKTKEESDQSPEDMIQNEEKQHWTGMKTNFQLQSYNSGALESALSTKA